MASESKWKDEDKRSALVIGRVEIASVYLEYTWSGDAKGWKVYPLFAPSGETEFPTREVAKRAAIETTLKWLNEAADAVRKELEK